jgi:hypothetical protein
MSAFRGKAQGGGAVIDREAVREALAILAAPEWGLEVRALPSGASRVLGGDELDAIVDAVAEIGDGATGVYFCLNPVREWPLDHAVRVGDVVCRRWLLLDFDAVRPAGTNSSAAEHAATLVAAQKARQYLRDLDWPEPLLIDSGNGHHLLYRIDLPSDKETQALLRAVLKALAGIWDTDAVELDKKVHNASRISKLPGTWARKGPHGEERPHRLARILERPAECLPVPLEMLQAAAGLAEDGPAETPVPDAESEAGSNGNGHVNGNAFRGRAASAEEKRREAYMQAALDAECGKVAGASPGQRNNLLNEAAFALGTLVGGGELARERVEDALRAAARACKLHEDTPGMAGVEATIRSGIDAGMLQPRTVPEAPADPPRKKPSSGASSASVAPEWSVNLDGELLVEGSTDEVLDAAGEEEKAEQRTRSFDLYTIGALLKIEFPEPKWLVPGILSEGLNILAGSPKTGKSMLALNLALTVAGGGVALGSLPVASAGVLYLSLEDKYRRVKARALKMLKRIAKDDPALAERIGSRLTVVTDWPRQDEGGLRMLNLWLQRAVEPGLVIIDVWNRFTPAFREKGASPYQQDSENWGKLKDWTDRHSITSLPVHHTRKPGAGSPEDFVNEVSGTLGTAGAADGVIVLIRSRSDQTATLHVTGRDVADAELALEFEPETLTWKYLGTSEENVRGKVQTAVLDYLKGLGGASAFGKDIAEAIEQNPNSVRQACTRLFNERLIRKVGSAWAYPGAGDVAEAPF